MEATYFPNRSRLIAFTVGTLVLLLASIAIMLTLESLQYGVLRLTALIIGFIGVDPRLQEIDIVLLLHLKL